MTQRTDIERGPSQEFAAPADAVAAAHLNNGHATVPLYREASAEIARPSDPADMQAAERRFSQPSPPNSVEREPDLDDMGLSGLTRRQKIVAGVGSVVAVGAAVAVLASGANKNLDDVNMERAINAHRAGPHAQPYTAPLGSHSEK
jgi:hypothetical protein